MASDSPDITGLLHSWKEGDKSALDQLVPLIYPELRRLAGSHIRRERTGHTLQATDLVHEAFIRLAGGKNPSWENRLHFYSIAARLMRQVLVDHAREHAAQKRGGGVKAMPLDESLVFSEDNASDLLAIDLAIESLNKMDERKAQIFEMRFFSGLTAEEIATVMNLSAVSIRRELRLATAWVRRSLTGDESAAVAEA